MRLQPFAEKKKARSLPLVDLHASVSVHANGLTSLRIDRRAVGWGQSHSASLRIVAVNNPIVYSNNPLAEGDLVGREVDLLPPSSLIEFDVWNLAVSLEESIPWDTC